MKKLTQFSVISILLLMAVSQIAVAQVSAGAGMAFGSEIEQTGVQGDLHYRFSNLPALQLGAGFIYYFPKDNHHFTEFNLNGSYIFYEEFMFKSYAYTGLNYARSKVDSGNISGTETAFGLNIGLGAEYDFGSILAFGDLKYVVSKFDQPVFSIGIRVPFRR
jgi:hypothetical protein